MRRKVISFDDYQSMNSSIAGRLIGSIIIIPSP